MIPTKEETIAGLVAALDAIARAHDREGSCSEDCDSWNDGDDCSCGYVDAADDVVAFARAAIAAVPG
jgi:hypothetical protein